MLYSSHMKRPFVWGVVLLGVACVAVALLYGSTPAQLLPTWLPGFDAASAKIHYKHAIGAAIVALGLFALAWFGSAPAHKEEELQK